MIIQPTHTCFDDALDYLGYIAKHRPDELQDYKLVHAACHPDGYHEHAHAWVEHGDEAIGAGLVEGQRCYYFADRRDYYRYFRPVMMIRYTPGQAYQENKRTGHYGPWESYLREMILRAPPADRVQAEPPTSGASDGTVSGVRTQT